MPKLSDCTLKVGAAAVQAAYFRGTNLLGAAYKPVEHLVLVGASIEVLTFPDTTTSVADFNARVKAAVPTAPTIAVYNNSVNSRPTGTAYSAWPSIRSGLSALPKDSRTLVVFMCWGNDISNMRPYGAEDDAAIATIVTQLNAMVTDCETEGWDWHVIDISFRDYALTFEDESNGARPYEDRITPVINASRPQKYQNRRYADNASWVNYYGWFLDNAHILKVDGTHPEDNLSFNIRQYLVDSLVAPSYTGVAPQQISRTIPAVGSDTVGAQAVFSTGYLDSKAQSANASMFAPDAGKRSGLAKNRSSGARLPWVLRVSGTHTNLNNGGNTALTVPGYFTGADLSHSVFCSGTTVKKISIKRLTPGASYELVMSGSRGTASTDTTRMTRIDIVTGTPTAGGASQQYSASNPASGTIANSVTFVVTPDASGVIEFEMSNYNRTSTTDYGYLGALSVKRVV